MSQRYIGGLIYNPPGGFSGYFDGSGDQLNLSASAISGVGSSNFSIECWVFASRQTNTFAQGLVSYGIAGNTSGTSYLSFQLSAAGNLAVAYAVGSSLTLSDPALFPINQWAHAVVCRSGSTLSLFVNGNRVATASTSATVGSGGDTLTIGGQWFANSADRQLQGYLSNVRIVNGASAYDATQATITVPSGPLQAITNTSLLTCAYGTFRDGSSNNFTITVNGNTAVSTQNPFPQTQLPNPALGNQGNGVYSMSQYQALRSQNLWPASDPYFDYVTLMLHGNGTNGAQNNTFLDSSTNNFTITRNGNTTQGTFTPYGANWSNFFDGSGDYLSVPGSSAFAYGTGSFTIEFWIFGLIANDRMIYDSRNGGGTGPQHFTTGGYGGSLIGALRYVGSSEIISTAIISDNTWHHCAIVRNGSSAITLYVDGVASGSGTDTTNYTATGGNNLIGRNSYGAGGEFNGYLSNFRIVKGTALYTSNFTPSTSPLTAITNTSLLTCADNRFIDDSSNNFTITRNGDVSVQRFSPFAPTTPYAAGTIGGSGYFDGTGDYLSGIGTTSSFNFMHNSTALFTFECWLYWQGTTPQIIFATNNASSVNIGASITLDSGDIINVYITRGVSGASNVVCNANSVATVPKNTWTHIAVTYDQSLGSNNAKIYFNGVLDSQTTKLANAPSSSNATYSAAVGGGNTGVYPLTGYLSNLRVSNSIVYSSAFTPPTTPVTGGTLLLNFTNGGIIDNAMMNNLETVGNAQISTSVSKFGGGSLAFDGNGDYLTIPPTQQLNFGSGNFTFEFWAYLNTTSGSQAVWHTSNFAGDTPGGVYIRVVSGAIEFAASTDDTFGTRVMVTSSTSLSATTWTHVACVRNGNTLTIYINGTSSGSATFSGSAFWSSTYYTRIGYWRDGDIQYLNAYLDDLRITRGYARYTTNFTPQRSQWQDQ